METDKMNLSLDNIGKRFKFHWIFRHLNLNIRTAETIAIKGSNGSGKSTLLKIISGFLSPSEGKITFEKNGKAIEEFYQHITFAAPYVDLIEHLTLREQLDFHQQFKSFKNGMKSSDIIDVLQLDHAADKSLKDYSSGMRQRVRLGLSVLSESDICILDEPTTNLDVDGFQWYADLLRQYQGDSAMVIASNEERDFVNVDKTIEVLAFKETKLS